MENDGVDTYTQIYKHAVNIRASQERKLIYSHDGKEPIDTDEKTRATLAPAATKLNNTTRRVDDVDYCVRKSSQSAKRSAAYTSNNNSNGY